MMPNQSAKLRVTTRFTECVVPAAGGHFFNGGARLGRLALTDCELHGGSLNFNAAGTYARVVALTNNVLNRVPFSLGTGSDTTLTTYARNNLFRGVTTGNLNAATGNAWEWRDNLFDTASLWQYFGGVANGNNAYRNCPQQLTPAGSGNVTLTLLNYTADAWGRGWYVSTTPSLLNAGSRTASAAGLYHHTTLTSQAKEQSSQVDIGFHYVVASTSTGLPADTDGEGSPDYFEDANGDGVVQATETNPASVDSDGDGISDAAEVAYGLNPSNPDTDGNGIPDGQQHVSTAWYSPGGDLHVSTPSLWVSPVTQLGELTLLLAQGTQRARVEVFLSSTESCAGHFDPSIGHTGDAVRWAIDYPKSPANLEGNTTVHQKQSCLECNGPTCSLFDQWLDVSEATALAASFIRVRLAATKGTDCFDRYSSIFVRVTARRVFLRSIEFTSDHGLLRKNPTSGSVWGDRNTDYESPEWVAGSRNNPISQTKNTKLSATVEVMIEPLGIDFDLIGDGPNDYVDFETTGQTSSGANQDITVTADANLPDQVCILTKTIDWRIRIGTTECGMGSSGGHTVYVTYGTPAGSDQTAKRIAFSCECCTGKTALDDIVLAAHAYINKSEPPRFRVETDEWPPGTPPIWMLLDPSHLGGSCIAHSNLLKYISNILGIPGGSLAYVYSSSDSNFDSQETHVIDGRTCTVVVVVARDGGSYEWNLYEGCLYINNRYYPGAFGTMSFATKQAVHAAYAAWPKRLVYMTIDGGERRFFDKTYAEYSDPLNILQNACIPLP